MIAEVKEMMNLAIDAMSGDLGSKPVVEAVKEFIKDNKDVRLQVVGKEEELSELQSLKQVTIIDAKDVMGMTESILAVRRKKESSMFKAVHLVKNNEADAIVSCGNTGAYYASCMLFLKRIEGVEKSCLMATMPTYNRKGVLMLDVGANAENTPEQLTQFAVMGSIYASLVNGIASPKLALLNIGSEEKKGDEVHQATYKLLKDSHLNFQGNIEGREILDGEIDVVVTDGFSGNIALKSIEGTAKMVMKLLKETLMSSTSGKIGALIAKSSFKSLMDTFDYRSAGGALMVGFDHPVIKAHGGSDAKAFLNAMILAKTMVEADVVSKMKEGLNNETD